MIKEVINQTEEMGWIAIKKDTWNINYIQKPTLAQYIHVYKERTWL